MTSIRDIRAAIDGTGRRRFTTDLRVSRTETRADGSATIHGYAAVFDTPATIHGIFVERIKRGAFRKALAAPNLDVPLLFGHDGQPVARTTNSTLQLTEDPRGLHIVAELAPTTLGRDLLALIERGDLSQMSFAFATEPAGVAWRYADTPDALDERDIYEFSALYDVSVVTRPAYDATSVELAPRSKDPRAGTEGKGSERSTPSSGSRGSIRGALTKRFHLLEKELSTR